MNEKALDPARQRFIYSIQKYKTLNFHPVRQEASENPLLFYIDIIAFLLVRRLLRTDVLNIKNCIF